MDRRIRHGVRVQVERNIQNIALVGFMGTGKSSVGHQVADLLQFRFLDTDHLIEQRAGMPISEIFARHGEEAFRDLEARVVTECGQMRGLVISTGGGLIAHGNNLEVLKQHAFLVCLWASPEAIWQRVGHQSHRPLLQCDDPMGRIRELLAEREPFYRQADALLNTEMRTIREVAHHVVHQFQLARQSPSGK